MSPTPPFPSVDDIFYLVGYPLVLGGMLAYVHERMGKRSILVWTDVTMGALCVAAIGTSLLLDYVLTNTTGTPDQIAVAVAYPLFDVATIAVAIGAFALTGWRPGLGLGLVILGLVSTATGDAIYTYQSVAGTYTDSAWYLFLWPLGTVLIALGAVQPSPKRRELPTDEGWRTFASPVVFALAIFALMTLQRQDMNRPIVEVLTAATLVAIAARIILTFGQNRRLVIELETDSLTGLANRGKLLFDLDRFYSGNDQTPHLLAILDLDGFKAYNDAFGHPAGDSLLIRLGHQLGDAVGSTGRAYRMGGDEFALIVPGEGAQARGAIEDAATALSDRGEGFQVTCSAGWAAIPREATNRRSALQLADQRMYEHKDLRPPIDGRRGRGGADPASQPARSGTRGARHRGEGPCAGRRRGAWDGPGRADHSGPRLGTPRHRQDRDPRRGPHQGGAARRGGVGVHSPAHDPRRAHRLRGAFPRLGRQPDPLFP